MNLKLQFYNLTYSSLFITWKKILSVLEHLNRKWGNSGVASGELMSFPYGQRHMLL